ncbi:hypothetical protein [Bacillus manliponensis]|uniref:Permease n=1 Tax=Bacillus manliponensis TaxID=574376 RepID=A0A073KCM7_9BACI|nr:hypothetical protein [Bacillus manliponensis]KEK20043.1 permease [Bacillus manliponensis]
MSKKYKQHKKTNQHKNIHDEEYAAEIYAQRLPTKRRRDLLAQEENSRSSTGTIIGYLALFLALFSIAFYPLTFGITSVILGLIAVFLGAKTLGYTAIGFGAFSVLFTIFYPLAVGAL